jgi:arylformamidase
VPWIDLSLPIHGRLPVFPDEAGPRISGPASYVGGRDREYVYRLELGTQCGTHVQGQHYFDPDGKRITDYPPGRFVGALRVIDCPAPRIGLEVLRGLPADLSGYAVVLRTGFLKRAGPGGWRPEVLAEKPGLTLEAAAVLCARGLALLGVDAPGVEPYPPRDGHPVNRLLGRADVLIVENLWGVEALPRTGGRLYAFPLPVEGVEGTPCRAVAEIP